MRNFDEHDQVSIGTFVRTGIGRHKQFALSTVDSAGNPWVVCLNLSFDDQMTIIWKSMKTTEHSMHIAANPNVAVCIFSETTEIGDFGFYATATAHAVQNKAELARLLQVRYAKNNKPVPPLSDFMGTAPGRLYAATITRAWVNDDRHIKTEIDMGVLRSIAKMGL